jgi:hypothetical protein
MKKLITICALAFLVAAPLSAKGGFLRFGFKAGMNVEQSHFNWNGASDAVLDALRDPSTGWHAGLVARLRVPLLPIFAQGELLYNWNRTNVGLPGGGDGSVRWQNFSAPVMAGVGVGLGDIFRLRLNLGPVFNFGSSVRVNLSDIYEGDAIAAAFERRPVTWTAGLGLDLLSLMFDARYNGSFGSNKVSLNNIRTRPTSWSFSLGLLF